MTTRINLRRLVQFGCVTRRTFRLEERTVTEYNHNSERPFASHPAIATSIDQFPFADQRRLSFVASFLQGDSNLLHLSHFSHIPFVQLGLEEEIVFFSYCRGFPHSTRYNALIQMAL